METPKFEGIVPLEDNQSKEDTPKSSGIIELNPDNISEFDNNLPRIAEQGIGEAIPLIDHEKASDQSPKSESENTHKPEVSDWAKNKLKETEKSLRQISTGLGRGGGSTFASEKENKMLQEAKDALTQALIKIMELNR